MNIAESQGITLGMPYLVQSQSINANSSAISADDVVSDALSIELSAAGVATARTISNQFIQQKLSTLGFFSGPYDGDLTSSTSRKAITNFQKVYGISASGTLNNITQTKLNKVYSTYSKIYSTKALKTYVKNYRFDTEEVRNIARIAAFFKEGLNLDESQAAGFLGNIHQESRFSPDNLQDGSLTTDHDSEYQFNATDGKAYGIVQWAFKTRKQLLQNSANQLNLPVSDLNSQLYTIRIEMNGEFKGILAGLRDSGNEAEAAEIIFKSYESPNDASLSTRQGYAKEILSILKEAGI